MSTDFAECLNPLNVIKKVKPETLDFAVVSAGVFTTQNPEIIKSCLQECTRALKHGGLLFLQGHPKFLPSLGVFLDQILTFKYWIAVESEEWRPTAGLPSVHAGILLFVKGKKFDIPRMRFPHRYCAACGKTLRDWGGKSHLMHPDGRAISDVWMELPQLDNYNDVSPPVLEMILRLADSQRKHGLILTGCKARKREMDIKPVATDCGAARKPCTLHEDMTNVILCGNALEKLREYPDGCIDLAFADPPYNLQKSYGSYRDALIKKEYVNWCDSWLAEYVRILKPTGSLYVLNLPRWSMYHAEFLNKVMHFQNWIVWNAPSEPRGKLVPAHYSLLFYTKHPTEFTFNYNDMREIDSRDYCLRTSCIRRRKSAGEDKKETLTDFWWDIHRIKHRRSRDYHPCQLPDALLERIIKLSSNPGDIVLDAFNGVGTTTIVAARLGRKYIGIDIDPGYVEISRQKHAEIESAGRILRQSTRKPRTTYTKKELQMELYALANRLGRLPTPEDVEAYTNYDVEVFFSVFPTWGKALKAAKILIRE